MDTLPPLHPEPASTEPLLAMEDLADLELRIDVPLGTASVTIGDLLALDVASVLLLDRLTGEHLEVVVNGTPVARGEIRVHGERFAIRITEILEAPGLTGDGRGEDDGTTNRTRDP